MSVEPGIYRHYRNRQLYQVIGVGKHSETEEDLVFYEALYPAKTTFWARPLKMFTEQVELEGQMVPRFEPTELRMPPPCEVMAAAIDWMVRRGTLSTRTLATDAREQYGEPYSLAEAEEILLRSGMFQQHQ